MGDKHKLSNRLSLHPERLFLLDGIGALVSTLFLGVVLVYFQELIGMPKNVLYLLAAFAAVFTIYSISCYLLTPKKWKPFLKFIAIVNLLYCFLTMALMIIYYLELTWLGLSYFIGELAILFLLIRLELKVASTH